MKFCHHILTLMFSKPLWFFLLLWNTKRRSAAVFCKMKSLACKDIPQQVLCGCCQTPLQYMGRLSANNIFSVCLYITNISVWLKEYSAHDMFVLLVDLRGLICPLFLWKKSSLNIFFMQHKEFFFVRKIQGGSVNDLFKFIVNFSLNMFEIFYWVHIHN